MAEHLTELESLGWIVVGVHEPSGLPQVCVTDLGYIAIQQGRWPA